MTQRQSHASTPFLVLMASTSFQPSLLTPSTTRIQRTGLRIGGKGTTATTSSMDQVALQGLAICQQAMALARR